jgi:hypothetical protein
MSTKPKLGRPPVKFPRRATLGIRVSPNELERMKRHAKKRGSTVSTLALNLFRADMEA